MSAFGFVAAAGVIGLQSIQIKPKRSIGSFTAQVTIEEQHHDELEITQHPVEQGANVADHAFKRPAELVLKVGWSDSPSNSGLFNGIFQGLKSTIDGIQSLSSGNAVSQAKDVYAKLLQLQDKRIPFDVYTGKRFYTDMLIKTISTTTDKSSERSLMATLQLQQVIRVNTQTVIIGATPANVQANPSSTQPPVGQGLKGLLPATSFNQAASPFVRPGLFPNKGP